MSTFVTSIFENRNFAEMAVAKLESLGYGRDEISVLMDNRTRAEAFSQDTGTTAIDGHARGPRAALAATLGGALGAIVASAVLLGSVRLGSPEPAAAPASASIEPVVPVPDAVEAVPLGIDVAPDALEARPPLDTLTPTVTAPAVTPPASTNPIVAGPLRAVLAAAGTGGVLGALVGAGLTPDLAKRYERELESGGILIGVHARGGDDARVRDTLREISVGTSPT